MVLPRQVVYSIWCLLLPVRALGAPPVRRCLITLLPEEGCSNKHKLLLPQLHRRRSWMEPRPVCVRRVPCFEGRRFRHLVRYSMHPCMHRRACLRFKFWRSHQCHARRMLKRSVPPFRFLCRSIRTYLHRTSSTLRDVLRRRITWRQDCIAIRTFGNFCRSNRFRYRVTGSQRMYNFE